MIQIWLGIFFIQIVYVSCSTLRVILVIKGQRYYAAVLSMLEITIYMIGLNLVLQYLDQTFSLIMYALGYGMGILTGSWIEEKISLGYVTLKVITKDVQGLMTSELRNSGYGVTSWVCNGKDGERLMLEVLAKRKMQNKLYQAVLSVDPRAFIVILEPIRSHGGFLTKSSRR